MLILLLLVLCLNIQIAHANAFPIFGAGTESCEIWLKDRQNDNWLVDLQWVEGFLSAAVIAQAAESHNTIVYTGDNSAIADWIDDYCRENPTNQLEEATTNYFTGSKTFFRQ